MRKTWLLWVLSNVCAVALAASVLAGCEDDGDGDGDGDSGVQEGDGGGTADADPDAPIIPPELSGTVQDTSETALEGITVNCLNESGEVIDTATTDADGAYTLTGVGGEVNFIHAEAEGDNMGQLIAIEAPSGDVNVDDQNGVITVEDRDEYAAHVEELPNEDVYDDTKGNFVAGFTFAEAAAATAGGMNAIVDVDGEDAWYTFVLDGEPAMAYPINGGTVPLPCAEGPGVFCREDATDSVPLFFPNVDVGAAALDVVDGGGFACTARVEPTSWPIYADTRTLAVIDCELLPD